MTEKQTVWQMIKNSVENLGGRATNNQIKDYIIANYGDINERTILDQIIRCTINHDSRMHHGSNLSPRIANSEIDFLYQLDKGVGLVEMYDINKHGIWEIKKDKEGNLKVAQKKYGNDQIILKEHVINSMNISKIIVENDLEDKRLSQSDDADENRKIYTEIKTKYIDEYKFRYKGTPNVIIKDFLDYFLKKYDLDQDFEVKHFSFYGQKVNSYIWACIIKKDEKIKDRVASHYPQLYILINKESIRFGFGYGTLVKEDDLSITMVHEDEQLQSIIFNILKSHPNLGIYSWGDASTISKLENKLIINDLMDLKNNWNSKTLLMSSYDYDNIPINISEVIENTFNLQKELFKQTSYRRKILKKELWQCPKSSCFYKKIEITRNDKKVIESKTYKEIILHFLQHLKKENAYFGSIDIYDIFEKYTPSDILSNEDLSAYQNSSNIIWKTQIRSTLASLNRDGYLETDELEDIPKHYNEDITDKRQLRLRKRTKKFYEDFNLDYNDWILEYIIVPPIKSNFSLFENSKINYTEIIKSLFNKPQIILLGPPGTSKSYLAVEIAKELAKKNENFEIIQFHPSYSYEDFVEGITTNSFSERLEFIPVPKIFRKLCEKAQNHPEENFLLIIDEINRGNVEKIFGELIYGLEKRGEAIKTLYMDNKLTIPPNLLIIGTMNTVDLSIANIDAALRRRFYIVSMMPDEIILKNWLTFNLQDKFPDFQKELVELMIKLNKKIYSDKIYLGPYRQLGHTYFFVKSFKTIVEQLNNFDLEWKYSLRPLILEYLNFNEELMKDYDDIYHEFKKKIE